MTGDDRDQAALSERDLAVATLAGRYIERREHDATPCVHDLLAAAAEFGDAAVDVLRTVLACYEAMRTNGDHEPAPLMSVSPADGPTRHPMVARPSGACGWRGIGPPAGRALSTGGPHGHHHH